MILSYAARGQSVTPADAAGAQALFKRGRELIEAGEFAAGCPKFEASFERSPSVGALLNMGRCHERDGKPATAYRDYVRALELTRAIEDEARRKAAEGAARQAMDMLEPRVPWLRISAPDAPPGLEVICDGAPAALDEALALDPGAHEVIAKAPGHVAVTRLVVLEEGKTTPVIVVLSRVRAILSAQPTEDRRAPPVAATMVAKKPPPPSARVPVWAWGTGGAGLALAGVGAFFLADDLMAIHALQSNCPTGPGGTRCKAGYDYRSDNARKNRGLPLAIGFGSAGLAGLGAAVVGIAVSASSRGRPGVAVSPWLPVGGVGASVSALF